MFSSILGEQTHDKLGIILDGLSIRDVKPHGLKAANNHRLNCTDNANSSKNCHHLKKVIVCEHCFKPTSREGLCRCGSFAFFGGEVRISAENDLSLHGLQI